MLGPSTNFFGRIYGRSRPARRQFSPNEGTPTPTSISTNTSTNTGASAPTTPVPNNFSTPAQQGNPVQQASTTLGSVGPSQNLVNRVMSTPAESPWSGKPATIMAGSDTQGYAPWIDWQSINDLYRKPKAPITLESIIQRFGNLDLSK